MRRAPFRAPSGTERPQLAAAASPRSARAAQGEARCVRRPNRSGAGPPRRPRAVRMGAASVLRGWLRCAVAARIPNGNSWSRPTATFPRQRQTHLTPAGRHRPHARKPSPTVASSSTSRHGKACDLVRDGLSGWSTRRRHSPAGPRPRRPAPDRGAVLCPPRSGSHPMRAFFEPGRFGPVRSCRQIDVTPRELYYTAKIWQNRRLFGALKSVIYQRSPVFMCAMRPDGGTENSCQPLASLIGRERDHGKNWLVHDSQG
jgi:hypothetical protein